MYKSELMGAYMVGWWIILFLLACVILMDARSALKEFKKDRKMLKFGLHGILLTVLALLVINSLFVILKTGMEIPYFSVKIIHSKVYMYEN